MSFSNILIKSFQLSTLATALALAGCGGGGGHNDTVQPALSTGALIPVTNPSSSTDNTTANNLANVKSVQVVSNSSEFKMEAGNSIELSVYALNANNIGVATVPVSISITDPKFTGVFSGTAQNLVTDETGKAVVRLDVSSLTTEQKTYLKNTGVVVQAKVGNVTSSKTLKGIESQTATNPSTTVNSILLISDVQNIPLVVGSKIYLTAIAVDKDNNIIPNTTVNFNIGNSILSGVFANSSLNATTNEKGEAKLEIELKSLTDAQRAYLTTTGIAISSTAQSGTSSNVITLKGASNTTNIDAYRVFVSPSKSELRTGNDSLTLTIRVTDTNGGIKANAPVYLQLLDDGIANGLSFSKTSNLRTDANGVVQVDLVQSDIGLRSKLDHVANVKVMVNDGLNQVATQTLAVNVTGTTVQNALVSKTQVLTGETFSVSGTLADGKLNPINLSALSGSKIELINNGNVVSQGTTDAQGQFNFANLSSANLIPDSESKFNFSVRVVGADGSSQTINNFTQVSVISKSDITLNFTGKSTKDFIVNAPQQVIVNVPGANIGDTVYFSTTKGYVSSSPTITNLTRVAGKVSTDASGNKIAIFYMQSSAVGQAKLTVEQGAQVKEEDISFVSIVPAKISLQTDKTVVSVKGSTQVIVKVLDANDAPVKNAIVTFSNIQDASGGQLSAAKALTDDSGIATVSYYAGNNPTATNGVQITATTNSILVDGKEQSLASPLTATNYVTVQTNASYIGSGFSDKLSVSSNNVYYFRDGSIYVTNNTGQPAANQAVSISIVPDYYFAGEYKVVDAYWGGSGTAGTPTNGLGLGWLLVHTNKVGLNIGQPYYQRITNSTTSYYDYQLVVPNGLPYSVQCKAEDVNGNSFMDAGEDVNTNGLLDPINPVTILSASGQALGSGTVTMMTDSTGKLDFKVRYAKDTAEWFTAKVKISTKVAGTESVQERTLDFPVLETDVTLNATAPQRPNWVSPFAYRQVAVLGSNGFCTTPLK